MAQFDVLPGRNNVTLMNCTLSTLAVAAALCAGSAHAQSSVSAPVARPSSPAPSVVTAAAPAPSAPAIVQAPGPESAQAAVTQTVYTPQLPSATDLTNAAAAQGYTVERIVQTATQVIAFYRDGNGQPTTVAYQSLPPSGRVATPAPTVASAPQVVVTSPPQTVVYETAPRVVYYDYPSYYYPRVWYPPVSFGFGFGYRSYSGGHYHGGGFRHR